MKHLQFVVLGSWTAASVLGCSGSVGGAGDFGGGDRLEDKRKDTPDPGGTLALLPLRDVCTGETAVGSGHWRRLTASQYRNSVRDLLGIEADTKGFLLDTTVGAFSVNSLLPIQADDINQYAATAAAIAKQAVSDANLPRVLDCNVQKMGEDACANVFIQGFGTRAYRQALSNEQKALLTNLFKLGKEDSFGAGIELVIEGVLQSPNFLYIPEFGSSSADGFAKLTGSEVAARLSYLLWDTTPDADLMSAANGRELSEPEGIRKQARRLLNSPRFLAAATNFHEQLLGLQNLGRSGAIIKDSKRYPSFNDAMSLAMKTEVKRFVDYVFSKDDGSVTTLLTAPYVFPTGPLLDVYGVGDQAAPSDGKYAANGRFGLLTTAGVLAAHPHTNSLFPAVARGKLVRLNLLCTELPAPPMAAQFNAPANAASLSEQDLMRRHQDDPSCSSCHRLMEPVGFGLDAFDSLGKFRAAANDGSPVSTVGDIADTDVAGKFEGASGLTERLARSTDVRACLSEQWLRYTLGRATEKADVCSLQTMAHVLAEGKGDVRAALLALVGTDAFRYRKGQ